ncbi:DUF502 domain-containing protein [Amphritea japonica]|uniref:DUF502 domain-containing protein n=1 Tax=Amphritea japonica ATCC BAA-1530 TaxID=1278309 RepID=A0A7R6PL02_9GAMM|nr:DUF502 domain-containing protein [Amphritea japonica]BBB25423.1 conserved hypothetical protein [Amphritea japonica ATCC BAA-1530]
MKLLLRFFFQGLLILLPFVLTIYLVFLIFTALDETLFSAAGSLISNFIPDLKPGLAETLLGILLTVVAIILTGLAGSLYLTRFLMNIIGSLMERIPVVKLLYNSLKDLFQALLGDQKSFDKPVMVYLNREKTIKVMGFLTCEDLNDFGLSDDVSVYLPDSYNFSGNLIIVPRDQVIPLAVSPGQVTTFIVSGGVSTTTGSAKD